MTELLLTYSLHSTALLLATLLLVRLPALRRATARDVLLRVALIAPLITSWGLHPAPRAPLATSAQSTSVSGAAASDVTESFPAPEPETSITNTPSGARDAARREANAGTRNGSLASVFALVLVASIALASMRFGTAALQLRRLRRRAVPVTDPNLLAALADVRGSFDVHARIVSGLAVPLAAGRHTLLLPPRLTSLLTPQELRAVLAHEVAHLERRDPLWNALLSLISHLLPFQPLNWIALRAWQRAGEEACDERAADRTGAPLALARGLIRVAQRSGASAPFLAVGLTHRTHFTKRVEALLAPKEIPMTPRKLLLASLVTIAFALALPVLSVAQAPPEPVRLEQTPRAEVTAGTTTLVSRDVSQWICLQRMPSDVVVPLNANLSDQAETTRAPAVADVSDWFELVNVAGAPGIEVALERVEQIWDVTETGAGGIAFRVFCRVVLAVTPGEASAAERDATSEVTLRNLGGHTFRVAYPLRVVSQQ